MRSEMRTNMDVDAGEEERDDGLRVQVRGWGWSGRGATGGGGRMASMPVPLPSVRHACVCVLPLAAACHLLCPGPLLLLLFHYCQDLAQRQPTSFPAFPMPAGD